jgi:hypothetical protein
MGSLKLYHRRPHGGSYADEGGRGGRRKAKARLAPLCRGGDFPTGPRLQRDCGHGGAVIH